MRRLWVLLKELLQGRDIPLSRLVMAYAVERRPRVPQGQPSLRFCDRRLEGRIVERRVSRLHGRLCITLREAADELRSLCDESIGVPGLHGLLQGCGELREPAVDAPCEVRGISGDRLRLRVLAARML